MKTLAGMLACIAFATTTLAAPVTQLESNTAYTLNSDATYVEENVVRLRIDEQAAVRAAGQVPLPYSSSLQTLEMLEAYTTTKDGQRLEVTPDKIIEQQLPQSSGAPMFSDYKVKIVIFPQVEVGSIITLHYRRTQLKPDFPGQFAFWESPRRAMDVEKATISLTAPKEFALHIDTREAGGGEVASPDPALRKWEWTFSGSKGKPVEPRQVSARDDSSYVIATTLDSYEALAQAYDARARPMEQPSPEIRQLADEITKGIKDPRAQVAALYEWVTKNVRYVGIALEHGGYVPHAAEDIRAARYGDCKDHATLLGALLAAKKIRSSVALVHAGDSYFVPKVVTPRAFNHVITYLPDLGLFVDSTPGFLPFGSITPAEAGKQTLVIDAGDGKPAFRTLPLPKAATDWTSVRSEFTVAADGAVDGKTTAETAGLYQVMERATFASMPKDQLTQVVNRMLEGRGTGKVEIGDPRDFSKPFNASTTVSLPANVQLPGPGAMSIPAVVRVGNSIRSFTAFANQPDRKVSFTCPASGRQTEVTRVQLPDNLKVKALPKSVKLTGKFGVYESDYEQTGAVVVATRALTLEYPRPTCTPDDYIELRTLAQAVGQDLRAQIAYE
ncbi:MAG TPA: DUF3857 domain-containing protein [Steroidobacteraceae bacterium]|nr:DUF3857 domain-containing protein [Steroidobacteraceae bacterium]